jgi:hypothetical protein
MLQNGFMARLKARVEHPGTSLARRGSLAALLALTPTLVGAADVPPPNDIQQAAAPAAPWAMPPLDELRASRERPLFSPTRRPPAPLPVVERRPEPPSPPPPPTVALYGVVMDGGDARAIVRMGPGVDAVRVRRGDDIDGWKVIQIEAQRLVLSLDGRLATFTMFAGNRSDDAPPLDRHFQASNLKSQYQPPQNKLQQNKPTQSGASTQQGPRRPREFK